MSHSDLSFGFCRVSKKVYSGNAPELMSHGMAKH
jgi:hypothetical protein